VTHALSSQSLELLRGEPDSVESLYEVILLFLEQAWEWDIPFHTVLHILKDNFLASCRVVE
jgi:hypothetical protein